MGLAKTSMRVCGVDTKRFAKNGGKPGHLRLKFFLNKAF
jgi:hypothetical protein